MTTTGGIEAISMREFARRAGCNEKVVRRKVQSGHLPTLEDGKIDAAHVDVDWRNGESAKRGPADTVPGGTSAADIDAAVDAILNDKAIYSKAEAERIKENFAALLKQLEYDRESGAVAEIDDVVVAVASEFALVRNRLLNIGSKVAPRVAVMKDAGEIKALIDAEVVTALQELSLDAHGETDYAALRESIQHRFRPTS